MTLTQTENLKEILSKAHHDYEKGLNSHAFYKIGDYDLGKDLVQQTFMKTWVYLLKGREIHSIKAFLYHILNNLIIDEYRKKKPVSLDSLIEKGFKPKEKTPRHVQNILDGEIAFLLLGRLPISYRKVMLMKYSQDLSLKEISLLTGQSKNAISVRLHRGLEKLKVLYKHQPNVKLC